MPDITHAESAPAPAAMHDVAPVAPLPSASSQHIESLLLPPPPLQHTKCHPDTTSPPPLPTDALAFAASQAGAKIIESIAFLERIERIEIVKMRVRDGRKAFVIDMFVRPPHVTAATLETVKPIDPIALHANPLAGKQLESNYQVDRHFVEFVELRRMLQYISHLHGGKQHAKTCSYCKQVLDIAEKRSIWQSRSWPRCVTSQAKRRDLLAKFLRQAVALAVAAKSNERWSCEALCHVPLLVEKFLRKPADTASLGII